MGTLMYFFDSYAILEIIKGNPNYEKFKEEDFITNTLHLAEVFYSLLKEIGKTLAENVLESFDFSFIEISEEIAIDAALFRYKHKKKDVSYADCIGYVTSMKNNLKFLTGDKEFEKEQNVEFVKK